MVDLCNVSLILLGSYCTWVEVLIGYCALVKLINNFFLNQSLLVCLWQSTKQPKILIERERERERERKLGV